METSSDLAKAQHQLQFVRDIIQEEKLITGIGLVSMATILLLHVLCRMENLSIYLLTISIFTIIWGLTGISAYALD